MKRLVYSRLLLVATAFGYCETVSACEVQCGVECAGSKCKVYCRFTCQV